MLAAHWKQAPPMACGCTGRIWLFLPAHTGCLQEANLMLVGAHGLVSPVEAFPACGKPHRFCGLTMSVKVRSGRAFQLGASSLSSGTAARPDRCHSGATQKPAIHRITPETSSVFSCPAVCNCQPLCAGRECQGRGSEESKGGFSEPRKFALQHLMLSAETPAVTRSSAALCTAPRELCLSTARPVLSVGLK